MVLNIDDYHSIHTKRMPNTTITSTAVHLVTILMNPIMTQPAILKMNIHNPVLVDAELIKTNIGNRFMKFYGLSYNRHWEIHMVDDDTRLEELTVYGSFAIKIESRDIVNHMVRNVILIANCPYSYDVRLKEKRNARLMKDIILIDLQENDLYSLDAYIKAINTVVNVPSMQQ